MTKQKTEFAGHEMILQPGFACVVVSSAHFDRVVYPPMLIERLLGLTWERKIELAMRELAGLETSLAQRKRRAASAIERTLASIGGGLPPTGEAGGC